MKKIVASKFWFVAIRIATVAMLLFAIFGNYQMAKMSEAPLNVKLFVLRSTVMAAMGICLVLITRLRKPPKG